MWQSTESQKEYIKTGDYYRIIEFKGGRYVTNFEYQGGI